jgi:phytoene dehydrogenase-like protein
MTHRADAVIIGAGPNGLVAANVLADEGWSVTVLEAAERPGGSVTSAELTEPGFVHDPFSSFYPLAAASPVMRGLRLDRHGLRWRHGPRVLAHPSADGTCAVLSRDVDETAASLEQFASGDGEAWRRLFALYGRSHRHLLRGMVTPFPQVLSAAGIAGTMRRDLLGLARMGLLPVRRLGEEEFAGEGGRRLLAGNALHGDLAPESAGSGFFGWLLACLGQDVGFPVAEGGAATLAEALVRRLESRGGVVHCRAAVRRVVVRRGRACGVETMDGDLVEAGRAVLAGVNAPAVFLRLLGDDDAPARVRDEAAHRFQLDAATFKVDWALNGPIPWAAADARLAPTVHLADDLDELTGWAGELSRGLVPGRPFVVFGQYSMVDPSRCPPGKEVAYAYTHVPQRIRGDALGTLRARWGEEERAEFADRMEQRVERVAPGFRRLIRTRHVMAPPDMERRNANLVGGAFFGGTAQLHQQLVFRPAHSLGRAETPIRSLFLASASIHPGGGVHGAPGAIAARAALNAARRRTTAIGIGAAAAAAAARRLR